MNYKPGFLIIASFLYLGCVTEPEPEVVPDDSAADVAADFWGSLDTERFAPRDCGSESPSRYYYVSASSVAALEEDLLGITPAADSCPIMDCADYLSVDSCLGGMGPLSAYGPLGFFSPVGDDWWNVSAVMDMFNDFLRLMQSLYGDWWGAYWEFMKLPGCARDDNGEYRCDFDDSSGSLGPAEPLGIMGPLGPYGPLGNAYYNLPFLPYPDNGYGPHLEAGGLWAPLGPTGPLGPMGALGPLGPVGALNTRGITHDSYGNWTQDGQIVRELEVDWSETSREELFEAQYLFFKEFSLQFMPELMELVEDFEDELESQDATDAQIEITIDDYLRGYFDTEFMDVEERMDFGEAPRSRTYELFEMYHEDYAARDDFDNDTSCLILGNATGQDNADPDVFWFTSRVEQFVTIVATPRVQLSDFDLMVVDENGRELARSMTADPAPNPWLAYYPRGHIEWVQIRLPANTRFQVRIWLRDSYQWTEPDEYKLYVTGSTEHLGESNVCGPHQVTFPLD